ncbi:ATP-binding cassette domain-containing protein [Gemmobacter nectariphilus]|uniref:thiamine ABC transporter ATP-binding protein n=1 Tax=Gemmobacter nectariphilus TaxID=220343 RepID=UPI000423B786|nr:ATP-binding cassette domain-containing protein [Gemmobacter nectariphilus]
MGLRLDHLVLTQGSFRLEADWQVPAGARVAVIGPSGAGKSTLLAAISGFLPPVAGRILWDGHDLAKLEPGARPLSILFQDGNLFPHLTVAQNLGLGLSPGLRLTEAQKARVGAVLAEVGLGDKAARKPAALSGGEQSRVALARALLRARPMLLLDEPFAALGPALKAQMLDLVDRIAGQTGATVLMVTHDPEDARRLCPLTVVVADGVAAPPAPTGALLDDPPPLLRAYLRG